MNDSIKCTGDGCPVKGMCRRFSDLRELPVVYFTEVPLKGGKCDFLLPIELKVNVVKVKLPDGK